MNAQARLGPGAHMVGRRTARTYPVCPDDDHFGKHIFNMSFFDNLSSGCTRLLSEVGVYKLRGTRSLNRRSFIASVYMSIQGLPASGFCGVKFHT